MMIRRLFCLILCIFLVAGILIMPVSAEENTDTDLSVTNGSHTLDAAVPLMGSSRIIDNSKATLLYEIGSDTLIHAWNADERMYPASLVKIMTALLAIEKGNLSDVVTVRGGAIRSLPSDSVSVRLQDGEMISLEDLIYCMIVYSANDAAAVIAEHIGGSQVSFVELMNQRALELGCTNTHFMNPHGIHHADQYTSARDIARILTTAMKSEQFRTIFGTVRHTVEATNKSSARSLVSGNHLMHTESMEYYYDSRITGGRTGVDYQGFRCVASVAEDNGMELISVVMGCVSQFEADGITVRSFGGFLETSDLLNEGFKGYRKRQIVSKEQVLRQSSVMNGDCDLMVGVQNSVFAVLPYSVSLEDLSFRYTDLLESSSAPISKGELISHLQVWYGPICLVQADVYALNDVPVAYPKVVDITSKKPGLTWWQISLIVIAAIIALSAGVLVGMRIYNSRKRVPKKTNRHRRKRG